MHPYLSHVVCYQVLFLCLYPGEIGQTDLPEDVITGEVAEKGDVGGLKLEGRLTSCAHKYNITSLHVVSINSYCFRV